MWPCRKIGQGQPRLIIWTNYDGPKAPMRQSNDKVNGPLVLEKKIFEGLLPYMGMVAILVMWPTPCEQTFVPPSHWGFIWNLALIGPAVLEKKTLVSVDGRPTDGQRTMATL